MSSYEKPDFWTLKAKKEGYPARSVFKLAEMQERFGLIKGGMRILDVGAAPGSWSLWILRHLKGSGFLSAVDLQPLNIVAPTPNFFFIQGDLYDPAVRAQLAAHGPYDLVLSDAAPSTSGNRTVDTGRSEGIVEAVLDMADEFLQPGGTVLAKLFVGGGERELLDRMRAGYASARGFKPKACRAESFETYLMAMGKKKARP